MTDLAFDRPPLMRTLRERPLWILLFLVIVFFARPLFLGQTFFFRDLTLFYFPQRLRLVELVRCCGVPFWDPYLHGGQPFLGFVNNLALYPTALLYFLLPAVSAFNIEIVLHYLLGALATYTLARSIGLSPKGAVVAGTVFTFCGFMLSLGNLLNYLLGAPWTVLLLLFWNRFLREGRTRFFLAAAGTGALAVFAGSLEPLLATMALALGWALVPPGEVSRNPRSRAALWVLLGVAIVGLAAVQIWPQSQIIRQAIRGSGFDYLDATSSSLNPRRLPELLVPGFLGSTRSLDERYFWGWRLEDGGYPYFLSIYFGLPACALALAALLERRPRSPARRFRLLLAGAVGAAILLALGRFLMLKPFLYRTIPFSSVFRYPSKALGVAVLPVALLAGIGAELVARPAEEEGLAARRVASIAAASCAALFLLLAISGSAVSALRRTYFGDDLPPSARAGLSIAFLHAAAAGVLFLLLVATRLRRARWMPAALAGVVFLDLATAGLDVNIYAPQSFFRIDPPLAREVRRELREGRFFRDQTPDRFTLHVPSNEIVWRYLWRRQTLDGYMASAFGIPVIFNMHYDGLAQRRLVRLTAVLWKLPWPERLSLLSTGDVTLLVATERLTLPSLELLGELPNPSDVRLYLYRNSAAANRVAFVTNAVFVDSETDALRAVLSRGFDPRRHVVLEGSGGPSARRECAPASIAELERRPTSWTGRVVAACDGYLVFSEPFYSQWRATVDGEPRPLLRANLAFSALPITAGSHVVTRKYRPASELAGGLFSILSAAMLIAGALLAKARRRARPGK